MKKRYMFFPCSRVYDGGNLPSHNYPELRQRSPALPQLSTAVGLLAAQRPVFIPSECLVITKVHCIVSYQRCNKISRYDNISITSPVGYLRLDKSWRSSPLFPFSFLDVGKPKTKPFVLVLDNSLFLLCSKNSNLSWWLL